MKNTIIYSVKLNKRLKAVIEITAQGQQLPAYGNDVVVKMKCLLPADSRHELHPDLRFKKKIPCVVGDGDLSFCWGSSEGDYRAESRFFHAQTWEGAIKLAGDYVKDQLAPLQEALKERKKALKRAGNWVLL